MLRSKVLLASVAAAAATAASKVPSSPVGLRNLGNTCYLNAQLQCAFHIPKVRELILLTPLMEQLQQTQTPTIVSDATAPVVAENKNEDESENKNDADDDDSSSAQETQPEPVAVIETPGLQALRQVFAEMLEGCKSPQIVPVTPRVLTTTLGIPVMVQQDSQEFWKLLLPALQVPALTELYQGSFEDYIVALDGSKREKRRQEAFLDLSLDVVGAEQQQPSQKQQKKQQAQKQQQSVMLSLQKMFGTPELLSVAQGNGWRPEKGADKVDAHKGSQLSASGLPSILQLHLKRFNYDWTRDVMEKINEPVSFPVELDLAPILNKQQQDNKTAESNTTITSSNNNNTADVPETTDSIYDLQSVLIHQGMFGVGHYYSYVRPNVKNDIWYRFNDHEVTQVSCQDVMVDSIGGKVRPSSHQLNGQRNKPCFVGWMKGLFAGKPSFGFGGASSNAYVLQYVRRSAVPILYNETIVND